ncbi:MAG TPA: glycosyltransferase [Acidimicrobiia bacterium]|nr:glycosyltransferase [Acidimicrobiia bacterium]
MTTKAVRGRVSVVVVNYRGLGDTLACLAGLSSVDWPDLEVVVVDNASGDGSAEAIADQFPAARVLALEENTGFAGGCNRGAAEAAGEYLAFLNNDARPDEGWLRAAIGTLAEDTTIGCVASKVLDWEGETVDFVASALSFYGHGFKLHVGQEDSSVFGGEADVLFASGTAMVMPAEVFRSAGGFDDRYFMFFEDVDLGWRLWLLGYRVRYVPDSLVFHRHHRSMADYQSWWEHYLLERNALFTIYKNYNDENLARALPAALMLAVRRGVTLGGVDTHALDLARRAGADRADDATEMAAAKPALASFFAVDAFVEEIRGLAATRAELQSARRRTDAEIVRMFRLPLHPNIGDPHFVEAFDDVVEAFDVPAVFTERRRIVVATGDTLATRMAGPAIRAWQISRALAREHEVVLVTTNEWHGLTHPDFDVRKVDDRELTGLVTDADVVIFQGFLMRQHAVLRSTHSVVIADIYDPIHLEQLEQARDDGVEGRRMAVRDATDVLNEQLQRGDLFLCASEKQRDFWLGQLAAVGRLNPVNYDVDETMDELVKIVPFGVSDDPPLRTRPVLRGVVPGIGPDDPIILWGGGIYNWFDPLTLLRAVDKLRSRIPNVRLFFLGLKHPNPHVPEMRMAVEARRLSDELGLTGTHVFFNEGWVEYEDRQNYLLEANIGVSTHLEHIETEFSFRTRILDYLWAGLPVVATGGDSFGALIERDGFGLVVPAGDAGALDEALFRLLSDPELHAASSAAAREAAESFRWSTVLAPLVEFCRSPRRAADLVNPDAAADLPNFGSLPASGLLRDFAALRQLVRDGELRTIVVKGLARFRQFLAR